MSHNSALTVLDGARVLVTGATGFTGSHLVSRLVALGCDVRAIVRPSSNRRHLEELGVNIITGDVFDAEAINEACQDVEYVFHVAAAYREAGISDDVYEKVHVQSTKLLAAAVSGRPGFQRFVHVSTVGVHGHIEEPPANEDAPYAPGDQYQITKLDGERFIREFSRQHGLPLTVIRPAAIFGPGDNRLLKVFKFAKWRIVPIIGRTRGLYHLIHVADLVEFMVASAVSAEAEGQVFICGNEEPTSIQGMIRRAAQKLGTSPTFVHIPAGPVFALARMVEWVCQRIGIEPPIYPRRVAFFTKDRAFDTRKMRGLPGFELRFDNESGIDNAVDGYVSNGQL